MAKQVGNFGAPALGDILVHRGIVRRGSLDHLLHVGMPVYRLYARIKYMTMTVEKNSR
jgi:hypothetical protein